MRGGGPWSALEGLSRAQLKAWSIIARMVRSTGRRCFTYTDLFRAWREYTDIPVRPQTLDRRVRELVELGILERVEGGRGARFCLRRDLYEWLTSGTREG